MARRTKGFTLLELLVVIAILGILMGLVTMGISQAMAVAHRVVCVSNLRQLGMAMQWYLDQNDGWFFPLVTREPEGNLWYFGFESDQSRAMGEGRRVLDRTRAKLYPYLEAPETVETCPSVPFGRPYKPKFQGRDWAYGINYELASHQSAANICWVREEDKSRTVLFADAAQICTWLPPATNRNPMVEVHYSIGPGSRQVQFRHGGKANVLFTDGHVESVGPVPNSLDSRLPKAMIGYFDQKACLFRPQVER